MKKFVLTLVISLFTTLISIATNNPDAVLGVWKNGEGTGLVQIYKKGERYFGKIVWLKIPNNPDGTPRVDVNNPEEKLRTQPLKGLENLRNFKFVGENKWEEGNIYDPKNGNTYSSTMRLINGNSLEVRGYIGVSLIGRTDTWTRQVAK